jgi:hypothetical protein
LTVDPLAPSIRSIPKISPISPLSVSGPLRAAGTAPATTAESATAAAPSKPASAKTSSAKTSAAESARSAASSACTSRTSWRRLLLAIGTGLSIQTWRPAERSRHFHERPAQTEIILPVLQSIADGSIHQECFIRSIRAILDRWPRSRIRGLTLVLRNIAKCIQTC